MLSIPVFCGKDCGGNACPLLADVEDGRVIRVRNNPAGGSYLKGCARGFNLPLEEYAPDRILNPLMRVGPRGSGQFREACWDEALNFTAEKLSEIREQYGANAVLNRSSAGVTGALHCTYSLLNRFLNLYGGCTRLSGNYSCGAAMFALPYVLGEDCWISGFDAATMKYAEMIVLWGANVLETRQGGEIPQRLMEAKRRGTQIVVIDPRRSATVKQAATRWIPCRPGCDTALMLSVLYVLFEENLADREFIAAHAAGFERLEAYVTGQDGGVAHTPEWAARICGVPAEEISHFAREYAAAKPAMLLPGYSIQRSFAGEETYRLAVALQLATGNFGVRGGSTGSINSLLPTIKVGTLDTPWIGDLPDLPVLRWPDAVLQGRGGGYPSDIHAIYNLGANAINQGGDIHKSIRAFEKVDFSVCHEIFMTPTARYCDVIFPAAGPLEKEDIGIPWLGNILLYKPQALPARGQARSDYDILCELAGRLGFLDDFSAGRSAHEWVDLFIEQSEIPDAEEFRRSGIYLAPEQERVGLSDFSRDPSGYPLRTPSGKVEVASERYHAETGFPAIPTWQEAPFDPRFPLRLITPKSALRTHSQGSNIPQIQERAGHGLGIHPQDAASRGIRDGGRVRLYNGQGVTHSTARISEDITPGAVSLPEGVWVNLDEYGEDSAGSANMLTSTDGTAASASAIMHGVGVEVEADRWSEGDVVVFRGVSRTKIWYALPVYVVKDTPELIALYWPAGTHTKLRMKSTRERFTPQDVLEMSMQLVDHTWERTDVLMLISPGAAHAIYVMWDADQKSHLCWYGNLQDPVERTPAGFDTCDHWLDVVFSPDRSGWRWKDEDELEGAVAAGLVPPEKAEAIRGEGERVIRLFNENQPPFCDGWENWSPPAEWCAPDLPDGWDWGFH